MEAYDEADYGMIPGLAPFLSRTQLVNLLNRLREE